MLFCPYICFPLWTLLCCRPRIFDHGDGVSGVIECNFIHECLNQEKPPSVTPEVIDIGEIVRQRSMVESFALILNNKLCAFAVDLTFYDDFSGTEGGHQTPVSDFLIIPDEIS